VLLNSKHFGPKTSARVTKQQVDGQQGRATDNGVILRCSQQSKSPSAFFFKKKQPTKEQRNEEMKRRKKGRKRGREEERRKKETHTKTAKQ
jgi:hypothetical protein